MTTFYFINKVVIDIRKLSTVLKIRKLFGKRATIGILCGIFAGLSGLAAIVTYYGQNVGNFVINTTDEAKNRGITLSIDPEFNYSSPKLFADSISKVNPIAQTLIEPDYVKETNGSYKSYLGNYIGYTFYMKNIGEEMVNVDVIMQITSKKGYVDEAVRVWFFNGEEDDRGVIYQKYENYNHTPPEVYQSTSYFENDKIVFKTQVPNFKIGDIRKFSIIIWVEGDDPDCVDTGEKSILGSGIKFGMNFNLAEELK